MPDRAFTGAMAGVNEEFGLRLHHA
jgi:hypothetical protein